MKPQVKIKKKVLYRYNKEIYINKWVDVLEPTKYTLEDYVNVKIPYNTEGGLNVHFSNIKKIRFTK